MKNTAKVLIMFIISIPNFFCVKHIPINSPPPPLVALRSYLISGPWRLVSATNYIDSKVISVYKGKATDTIVFAYGADKYMNVVLTSIVSYINGVNYTCAYQSRDSTIICTPAWKPNYSDTMIVKNGFSDSAIVIQVKNYNSNSSNQIEIDSLRKIRFW